MNPATCLTRDDQGNELEKQAKSLIISMIRFALELCDFVGISVSVLIIAVFQYYLWTVFAYCNQLERTTMFTYLSTFSTFPVG